MNRTNVSDILASLPNEWPDDLQVLIERQVEASGRKVVVLDDDPTGTQTVHGVPVLTGWSIDVLRAELREKSPIFYVLTNSRSLSPLAAKDLNQQIGRNLREASRQVGRPFVVISRSDSTLRGHFPGELESLSDSLRQDFDSWLFIPCFEEGGRYTVDDVHYVREGNCLIPASETEFARDAVFGYRESNLRRWVEEKSGGRISAESVTSISLNDLRVGGPETVTDRLRKLCPGSVCVVNSIGYRDLEVFTLGVLNAEAEGKRFLYRTAASFVRVRAAITPRPLLTKSDLDLPSSGAGLIVVGSYVTKSTTQVEVLRTLPGVTSIELCADVLLGENGRSEAIRRVTDDVDRALRNGRDVMAYTSRKLLSTANASEALAVGQRVSSGLVDFVRGLKTRPRYVLAKGGITSSDIATEALGVERCEVLGQILPGVPVWKLGRRSRHPGMTYIVFPGNVGDATSLADVVTQLR